MNGWVNEWMDGWMDGWTGSYTFFHLMAIPLRQPCWLLLVALVGVFYCPREGWMNWTDEWVDGCMNVWMEGGWMDRKLHFFPFDSNSPRPNLSWLRV
jgi:hypothetical protein